MKSLIEPHGGELVNRLCEGKVREYLLEKLPEEDGGDAVARAPALVAVPYNGYDLKGNVNKEILTEKGDLVGMHTFDDAMLYIRGYEIEREDIDLVDGLPTILVWMDVPVPKDVDGSARIGGAA